jgi:molecular chaperone GrpE (heat shock protein)
MASELTERRFGLGRMVRNAAPPEELVAKILEARTKSDENPTQNAPAAAPSDEKIEQIAEGLGQLFDLVAAVHEQHAARDKAFDLLYEELGDYKNDFFYERLKPIMRSLLFVVDSIEEFSREVEEHEKNGQTVPNATIKANLEHFRDQLVDSLHIAEMAPIERQSDEFDPKTQRAIDVVPVPAAQNNTVQRTIRGGWTMGGQILRPADVVVGKA